MHMRRGEYMLEEVAKDAWEYGRKFLLQGKVADISLSLGKQIQYILDYVLKQKSKRNIKLSLLMRHIQFSCNC